AESIIGQTVKFVIKKNKFGPYPRSCESKVLTLAGTEHTGKVYNKIGFVDTEEEWIDLGASYGIITKGGAWFNYAGESFQGKAKFAVFLKENPEHLKDIQLAIQEAKAQGAINDLHVDGEEDVLEQFKKVEEDLEEDEEDNPEEMEE
ncbi:MAG TPA: hypothetical protein VMX17_13385, partial [Candidatus Glassbacteria bacterium]|nr:hypothetical protein [Candidatus Glassbacteria bacterium]